MIEVKGIIDFHRTLVRQLIPLKTLSPFIILCTHWLYLAITLRVNQLGLYLLRIGKGINSYYDGKFQWERRSRWGVMTGNRPELYHGQNQTTEVE